MRATVAQTGNSFCFVRVRWRAGKIKGAHWDKPGNIVLLLVVLGVVLVVLGMVLMVLGVVPAARTGRTEERTWENN